MVNVGKHTSPMDPMGTENFGSKGSRHQVEGLNSRIVGRMIRAAAFYKFLRGPKDIVPIQHLGGLSGAQGFHTFMQVVGKGIPSGAQLQVACCHIDNFCIAEIEMSYVNAVSQVLLVCFKSLLPCLYAFIE